MSGEQSVTPENLYNFLIRTATEYKIKQQFLFHGIWVKTNDDIRDRYQHEIMKLMKLRQ